MSFDVQNVINKGSDIAVSSATWAGVGYTCARAFTVINPVHAALALAIGSVVNTVTSPLFNKIFAQEGSNKSSRLVGTALNITASTAVSLAIAGALGASLSVASYVTLLAISIASVVAVSIVFAGAAIAVAPRAYRQ